jgi:hypothetical protein
MTGLTDLRSAVDDLAVQVRNVTQQVVERATPLTAGVKELSDRATAVEALLNELVTSTQTLTTLELPGDAIKLATANAVSDIDTVAEALPSEVHDRLEEVWETAVDNAISAGEEALETLKDAVEAAAERLVDGLKSGFEAQIDGLSQRVKQKLASLPESIVETAVETAVAESAQMILTTQAGLMVTTAISPYLPAIYALKPVLPAIQDALDVLRGGM